MTEARRKYIKTWRANNVEKCRAHRKTWRAANPEKVRARLYRWRKKHGDHWRKYMQRWNTKNPFKRMAHGFKYLSKNHDASLFPILVSLNEFPWMETKILIDRITPLDELIMKEEGLN